ncbi:MAG: hypothetical protein ACRELB_22110, partial [Polyangiaceae bacterium]
MDRLLKIDRRWIFLLVFVTVVPVVYFRRVFHLPIHTGPAVEGIYNAINALPAGAPVMVAMDFDPSAQAELEPMSRAVMRHCFRKGLHLIGMTHWPTGAKMADEFMEETRAEFDDIDVVVAKTFATRDEAARFAETFAIGKEKPIDVMGAAVTHANIGMDRQSGPALWTKKTYGEFYTALAHEAWRAAAGPGESAGVANA